MATDKNKRRYLRKFHGTIEFRGELGQIFLATLGGYTHKETMHFKRSQKWFVRMRQLEKRLDSGMVPAQVRNIIREKIRVLRKKLGVQRPPGRPRLERSLTEDLARLALIHQYLRKKATNLMRDKDEKSGFDDASKLTDKFCMQEVVGNRTDVNKRSVLSYMSRLRSGVYEKLFE